MAVSLLQVAVGEGEVAFGKVIEVVDCGVALEVYGMGELVGEIGDGVDVVIKIKDKLLGFFDRSQGIVIDVVNFKSKIVIKGL